MEQAEDACEKKKKKKKTEVVKTGAGYEPKSANSSDTVIAFPFVIPTRQRAVTDDSHEKSL